MTVSLGDVSTQVPLHCFPFKEIHIFKNHKNSLICLLSEVFPFLLFQASVNPVTIIFTNDKVDIFGSTSIKLFCLETSSFVTLSTSNVKLNCKTANTCYITGTILLYNIQNI